ncbi:hypothetical protein LTR62_007849 [Meristemomyces frigidus]|uniref:Nuclear speckle splicing regulatory protein 1 N-terminal domain-containing protein n=1 Tax=Meristemomyces frigidus TaxID=1508187 RepID=A0AAN7YM55_9PEZI|nr:hypothetical protein LTR62_007849 [Meristemomyces frigidus]
MPLTYGLNVKGAKAAPVRKPIFDDDGDEDEPEHAAPPPPPSSKGRRNGAPPLRRKEVEADHGTDLSSMNAATAKVKTAEELDPTIFDYDSFHDAKTTVSDARKAASRQEAIERKPKYINNLLDAAARRKQDQTVAKEKLLQKERENEGDEFADKEKFVTGAYKEQQEETRRLEEEERVKAEAEEKRKRALGGGGMRGFYKSMMDMTEQQHQAQINAAAQVIGKADEEGGKPIAGQNVAIESTAELEANGININDDGQIIDKRELLTAGLNISTQPGDKKSGRGGADHLRTSALKSSQQHAGLQRNGASRDAQRERQTRMMEEQIAEKTKRAREEEGEERLALEKAAKTLKTEGEKMDAKSRYLARKAAKERGEG